MTADGVGGTGRSTAASPSELLSRADYNAALSGLRPDEAADYLRTRSGLPGPRANLTLLDAAADVLDHNLALELVASPEEYLACCGVATLGRLILDDPTDAGLTGLLTRAAGDQRWRVREAAAIAGQRIGDQDPVRLRTLVRTWLADGDPLVVRAAIASVCEPRLLRDPATAGAALDACEDATRFLRELPPQRRAEPDVRTLRQGLGYCWSVAVAASPESGLPRFAALDSGDPDVAWVVRENLRKARLRRLMG